MNLGDSDGGRAQGAVVAESFECVCALAAAWRNASMTALSVST
jgi:hypothetical protein